MSVSSYLNTLATRGILSLVKSPSSELNLLKRGSNLCFGPVRKGNAEILKVLIFENLTGNNCCHFATIKINLILHLPFFLYGIATLTETTKNRSKNNRDHIIVHGNKCSESNKTASKANSFLVVFINTFLLRVKHTKNLCLSSQLLTPFCS